jgi:diaminobutyrate-2-oxoglutarate transaminase
MTDDHPDEYPISELHFADAPSVENVPGPNSRRLVERQQNVDTSAVKYADNLPIALAEGKGATVKDVDGNVFLDFFAGIGVVNVGHSNPYVTSAVDEQTRTLVQTLDFPTEPRLELIDALDRIAPGDLSGDCRVLFGGPTGSNAVEGSIKLAKYNTGGHGLVSFRGAYHGSTSGAMTLTAKHGTKADYTPLLPDSVHVRYPYPFHDGLDPEESKERALDEVREVLGDPASGLTHPAGVWVEPIQGEGGVVVPPEGFLAELKEITAEHDVPLVVDEIQSGFGRTGTWFASEHENVTPDAVVVGKAIGGVGLPLSAVIYRDGLDTWESGAHTGTFRGYLPAMRAGVRAIEYIEAHDLLDHATELGEYIRGRLRSAAESVPALAEVRGRGLFVGAEFVDTERASGAELVEAVQARCCERGVIVWTAGRRGSVLRLLPPLVMTREQAATGLDIIVEVIEEVTSATTRV